MAQDPLEKQLNWIPQFGKMALQMKVGQEKCYKSCLPKIACSASHTQWYCQFAQNFRQDQILAMYCQILFKSILDVVGLLDA